MTGPAELDRLVGWFAEVGVILVIQTPLRGSKIDGAVFRRADSTPVIGLTLRGDRFDILVFTLLHEVAHLVKGHLDRDIVVDVDLDRGESIEGIEGETNRLAATWIFPNGLTLEGPVSTATILELAEAHKVHPSLVIGRLQHAGQLGWNRFRNHIPRVRPHLKESTR